MLYINATFVSLSDEMLNNFAHETCCPNITFQGITSATLHISSGFICTGITETGIWLKICSISFIICAPPQKKILWSLSKLYSRDSAKDIFHAEETGKNILQKPPVSEIKGYLFKKPCAVMLPLGS